MSEFVDPGIGKPNAKVGTKDWAERWRLNVQSISDGTEFNLGHMSGSILHGIKQRAWTLITDKTGKPFKDFREFISAAKPYGLQKDPEKFIKLLELELGKQAVQLETVSEPAKRGPKPKDVISLHDVEKSKAEQQQDFRLTAINRAPPIVGELYRDGLINQTDAAKLGKKDADRERIQLELTMKRQEVANLPKKEQRKIINASARTIHGSKPPTPAEKVVRSFKACNDKVSVVREILALLTKTEIDDVLDGIK